MKIVHAAVNQAINLNTFSTEKSGAVVKNKSFEVYKVILEKGRVLPPHHTKCYEIVQCLAGKGTITIEGDMHELTSGSWLHIKPGAVHSIESRETTTLLITKVLSELAHV
jgi:quercetin dioxygenase-like cupin family protein